MAPSALDHFYANPTRNSYALLSIHANSRPARLLLTTATIMHRINLLLSLRLHVAELVSHYALLIATTPADMPLFISALELAQKFPFKTLNTNKYIEWIYYKDRGIIINTI